MKRTDKLRRITISRVILALATVGGSVSCFWLIAAEPIKPRYSPEEIAKAKKHADYGTLAHARTLVVGGIHVDIEGVAESDPPVYEMRIWVTPTQAIAGNAEKGKPFSFRHSLRQDDPPKYKDVDYIVALGDADSPDRVAMLRPARDELITLAKVATFGGQAQRERNAKLAVKNPEMHPLFERFAKAEHLILIRMSGDSSGGVSFTADSRLETHESVAVVNSLKGDIKAQVFDELDFTEDALGAKGHDGVLLAQVELRERRPVVVATWNADEETVRVAAAAAKSDVDALLTTTKEARGEHLRQRGASSVRDIFGGIFGASSGASSGESTPSPGPAFDSAPGSEDPEGAEDVP